MDAATQKSSSDDPDWNVVRGFVRDLKIACDDLHAEPFNPEARSAVLHLLQNESSAADVALNRIAEATPPSAAGRPLKVHS